MARKHKHIYIQRVKLERNIESGQMEVKVTTNHGRFILGVNSSVVAAFYDHIAQVARRDITAILEEEDRENQDG